MATVTGEPQAAPTPRWLKIATVAGGVLLLLGAVSGFLLISVTLVLDFFLPVFGVVALYLALGCGGVAAYHGFRSLANLPSGPLRPPSHYWLVGLWVLLLGVGGAIVLYGSGDGITSGLVLAVMFLLAASLPVLIPLAAASRWLAHPTTWRRGLVAVASGSVLSVQAAIVLEIALPVLILVLVLPLREGFAALLDSRGLERLFYSREFIIVLVTVAVVAPLAEELTKPLGCILLGRSVQGPREAFLLGMSGGAGFAILENMVYMGGAAWFGDPVWLGIAAVRGLGGVLHPFNGGLVALGWYRSRQERSPRAFLTSYLMAVLAHAAWNGFFVVMAFTLGSQLFPEGLWTFTIYGVSLLTVELLFMLLLTALLWWGLTVVCRGLMGRVAGRPPEQAAAPVLALATPRQLALWATVWLLLVAPVGFLAAPLVKEFVERL